MVHEKYRGGLVEITQRNKIKVQGLLTAINTRGDFNAPDSVDVLTRRLEVIKGKSGRERKVLCYIMARVFTCNVAKVDAVKDTALLEELKENSKIRNASGVEA